MRPLGGILNDGGDLVEGCRGLFEGGCLLLGALRQVVAGIAQFGGVAVHRFRRFAHFAHRRLQGDEGIVDVLLQLGEGAPEVAAHRLGEVAFGKACDDAAGLADAGIDARQQRVDVAGELVEVVVLVVLADAVAEIAGRSRSHDDGHARLQVVALGTHRRFLGRSGA